MTMPAPPNKPAREVIHSLAGPVESPDTSGTAVRAVFAVGARKGHRSYLRVLATAPKVIDMQTWKAKKTAGDEAGLTQRDGR